MDNPYVEVPPNRGTDGKTPPPGPSRMVGQVPIVAMLMIVQGVLELLLGTFLGCFSAASLFIAISGAQPENGRFFGFITLFYGGLTALHFVAGTLHIVAGWRNYR